MHSERQLSRGNRRYSHPIVMKLRRRGSIYTNFEFCCREFWAMKSDTPTTVNKYAVSLSLGGTCERHFRPPRRVLRTIKEEQIAKGADGSINELNESFNFVIQSFESVTCGPKSQFLDLWDQIFSDLRRAVNRQPGYRPEDSQSRICNCKWLMLAMVLFCGVSEG